MNGKGSRPRPVDIDKFNDNFDRIFKNKQEPMISGCSIDTIRKIVDMRRCGLPYKTIAHKIGVHKQTVNRWHRVYEKFGEEAFAGSFEDV